MGSGTNQEKHDPSVGTRGAPNPPPRRPPPPTHERDTAPLPTPITRGDTVSPSPRADTRPGNPMGETQSPLPEKSHVETPPKRLSLGQHEPTQQPETAPTQGRNGSRGRALRREAPRGPRRRDHSELPSLSPDAAGRPEAAGEARGGPETAPPRGASFRAAGPALGRERAPKTRRPQGLPAAGEENRLAESLARRGPRSHGPQREDTTPRDSQGEREGPGSPQSEGGPSPLRLCETGYRDPRREVSPRRPSPYQETRSEVGVGDRLGPL